MSFVPVLNNLKSSLEENAGLQAFLPVGMG